MENKVKLNMLPKAEAVNDQITLKNGTVITVRSKIPYEELFDMITWALTFVMDDRAYVSAPIYKVVEDFAVLRHYTDIDVSFMDGVELDAHSIYENYDLIKGSTTENNDDMMTAIRSRINGTQMAFFHDCLKETIANIVEYRNSARGVVTQLSENSKEDSEAIEKIFADMSNEEGMDQVKKMMDFYANNA